MNLLDLTPTTFVNPTTGETVSVVWEYERRRWPSDFYRATLDKPVVGSDAEEALIEHINADHFHGASLDYWIDDDHKVAQFTVDATLWED